MAAGIAGATPIKVGLQSMRLGTMHFVPFFFVLNPALILRGEPLDIVMVVITAFVGIQLIASAFEAYLIGFGPLGKGAMGWVSRMLMFAAGLALALPGGGDMGVTHLELILGAIALFVGALVVSRLARAQTPSTA